jgi:hypothetical protein
MVAQTFLKWMLNPQGFHGVHSPSTPFREQAMNNQSKTLMLVLAGALLGSAVLAAQDTVTPRREAQVEGRAARQQRRIAQGAASGELTPKETRKLEMRQGKLTQDLAKAEADGKITRKEQAKLNKEANKASKKIYKKKHNDHKVD